MSLLPTTSRGEDHLIQCQAQGAKEQLETSLQTLDDWMQTQQTEPGIQQEIMDGLRQWNAVMKTHLTTQTNPKQQERKKQ